MSTLQQRIAELMRDAGASHADLVRVTGKTSSAITQIVSGPTKTLAPDTAGSLEREYGYRAEWLAVGKGPKLVDREAPRRATSSRKDESHWRHVALVAAERIEREGIQSVRPVKFLHFVDLLAEYVRPEDSAEEVEAKVLQHLRLVA